MTLPSAVLAYQVLEISNFLNEKHKLARATMSEYELTYDSMKKQFKVIQDSSSIGSSENVGSKSEPTYILETRKNRKFYSSNVDNTRGRFNNNTSTNSNFKLKGMLNKYNIQYHRLEEDSEGRQVKLIYGWIV